MDDLETGYVLAVAAAGLWSPRALASHVQALGSARAVVDFVRGRGNAEAPSCAERLSESIIARLALIDDQVARAALAAAAGSGARVVLRSDPEYPAALHDLCDAPLVLYVRGDLACLAGRCVAIVGSRAASAYGRAVAAGMASDFSAFAATVVSGLARGIDAAAHKGALDAGIPTVAVLGSGVRALYPDYHSLLADDIVERNGAVLSEFPPHEQARAFHFPMRNRVVAALSQATVVVEAGSRSGALITARLADELGRRVFAIPGDVGRPTSVGANALIADGVPLVTSAADIAALMGWESSLRVPSGSGADETEDPLLPLLRAGGCGVDELARACGASAAEISARLMVLELQGTVERKAGGLYAAVRIRPAAKAGV